MKQIEKIASYFDGCENTDKSVRFTPKDTG